MLSIVTDLPGDDAGGIEGSAETPEDAERMLEGEEQDASAAIDDGHRGAARVVATARAPAHRGR